MNSNNKLRTYGFVTLSILAHVAIAVGVIKYGVKSSDDMKEVNQVTEVEVEATSSPTEGNQQAEAPVLDDNFQDSSSPVAAPSTPKVEAPEKAPEL